MATSLLALLDDITTLLDDVSAMTKVAAGKTAGVLGDDLALNAEQVAGVDARRELPVVWAVCKGSLVNKAILVPLALLVSTLWPALVQGLLMLGGAYLCFEGVEKVMHSLRPHPDEEAAHHAEVVRANEAPDVAAAERDKIRGAIRTDFVLSAEIIVITLGTLPAQATLTERLTVLALVAVLMTLGVYGIVAAIVKIDDFGLWLRRRSHTAAGQRLGDALVNAMPWLMRVLSVLGTLAMFLVGGGILSHGIGPLTHWLHGVELHWGGLAGSVAVMGAHMGVGLMLGAVVLAGVSLARRLIPRRS